MRALCAVLLLGGIAFAKPKDRTVKLTDGSVVLPGGWFVCETREDCAKATGPRDCWRIMVPINKKFRKDAEKKMAPLCTTGEEFDGVVGGVGPKCQANECVD